jgi:5'-deoxynucleotidase YfbR-like HD superfamily hydrolase
MSTATLPLLATRRPAAPEGPWILTASGRPFALLHPEDSVIDIEDIAEALAKLCRWTGHTRQFYSVAQHSGIVHDILPMNARPYALLHDAHEAYIGDWSTPLKWAVRAAGGAETAHAIDTVTDRIDAAIHKAAGLAWPPPPEVASAVKRADLIALATEKRDLMPSGGPEWEMPMPPPRARTITPQPWVRAHNDFLLRFDALCRVFPEMKGLRRS